MSENGPITELFYRGNTYTALTYGECSETITDIKFKLLCGNYGASEESDITGYLYGYKDGNWEILAEKIVHRPTYTNAIEIFDTEISLPQTNNSTYTNFYLAVVSTDNERYTYAEITPKGK